MEGMLEDICTAPIGGVVKLLGQLGNDELRELIVQNPVLLADPIIGGVDSRSAARIISLVPVETLRDLLGRVGIEILSNFMKVAQPTQLSKALQNASNDLIDRIIDAAPSANSRAAIVKALPVERRKQWSEKIHALEKDIEITSASTTEAKSSLFEERKRLLGELEEAIRTKEEVLLSFEREAKLKQTYYNQISEEAQRRLDSLTAAAVHQEDQLKEREKILAARQAEFDETTRRQVQQRIEIKVPEYVAAAVRVLEDREVLYRKKATQWSLHGTIVLALAIIATVAISLFGSGFGTSLDVLPWQALLFVSFKGLVILSVLGLWAKHAFTVSNAYMHEAIKRSDRAHAINFGKLYLEIYGNSVDRKELLDIFENWNIASESAFAKANPDGFEPKIFEKLESALKVFEKIKSDIK